MKDDHCFRFLPKLYKRYAFISSTNHLQIDYPYGTVFVVHTESLYEVKLVQAG